MNTLPIARLRLLLSLLLLIWATTLSPSWGQAQQLKKILPAQKLDRPTHIASVPDGSRRMVVVEQPGRIRVFAVGAKQAAETLLDIRSQVSTEGWESGLLSIAFDPHFTATGHFYVYYSAASPRRSVVSRFAATPNTLRSVAGSEQVLLEVPQPYSNHNGGQLAFGPDGYLYIGLGDGGSGGDPQGHGQNLRTLLGAILRIDVRHTTPGLAYAIPADNPFVRGDKGWRKEIWAYGLRNPWRFGFDRKTGELYAADVGQNAVEEVNMIFKGANYGWNVQEGTRCFSPPKNCAPIGMVPPITQYGHDQGRSITGGFVYRGKALPALQGRYLFADFVSGRIWSIPAGMGGLRPPKPLLNSGLSISTFGEDSNGELYLADLKGALFKLVP